MKKLFPVLLSILLAFTLTACISDNAKSSTTTSAAPSTSSTASSQSPSTSRPSSSSSSTAKSIEHYCDATGCYKEGTKKYSGLGGIEYYCTTHYDEIMSIIGKMESDVGKGSASKHTCEVCSKEGTKSMKGISGATEYYCTQHYNDIMDMLGKMESDVGKGSASKHTCEVCSKEGTKSIIGLSGATEYYCTQHYNEMKDLLEYLLK